MDHNDHVWTYNFHAWHGWVPVPCFGEPELDALWKPAHDEHVQAYRKHQEWIDYDPFLDDMDRFHEAEDQHDSHVTAYHDHMLELMIQRQNEERYDGN